MRAAKEAAEVSIRAFEEAISGAGAVGKVIKEIAEIPAKTSQEVIISKAGKASAKEKGEDEKAQKKIESRLEFLARTYAANKARRAEKEDEEE